MSDHEVLTAVASREEPEEMRSRNGARRVFMAAREQLYRMFMARAGLAIPSPGAPARQSPGTRLPG